MKLERLNEWVLKRPFLTIIFLLGAALRLVGINNQSPPGLAHDEVANWLIDRSILAGEHAIYFTRAYGHEAGYHYIQAAFVALFGDNAFALRLPSAFAGILGMAVCFALVRKLFGRETAVYATALLAVLFWPIFYSRLALRAILLPVTAGLSAYFWLAAWEKGERYIGVFGNWVIGRFGERYIGILVYWFTGKSNDSSKKLTPSPPHLVTKRPSVASLHHQATFGRITPSLHLFTLSALFAALSLNIYLAARALPIFYALWIVYLAITDWRTFRGKIWGVVWFTAVFALLSLPLILFLQNNPGTEFRVDEVSQPLAQLRAGNLLPVWQNSWKILGMFGVRGDPLWRQNVAFVPVFEPIVGLLFYIGLLIVILRLKAQKYAFVLLWTAVSIIPSVVTINAPSTIRIVLLLPILTLFPAIVIHTFPMLSTVIPNLSTILGKIRGLLVLTIIFVYAVRSVWLTFFVWPTGGDIPFVWQTSFSEISEHIQTTIPAKSATVAGWSPDTMDSRTMALLFNDAPTNLSFFNPQDGMLMWGETAVYFPAILDIPPLLHDEINLEVVDRLDNTLVYSIEKSNSQQGIENRRSITINEPFGGQIELQTLIITADNQLITHWRTLTPQQQPLRLFMQLLNANGDVIAEDYHWDNLDPQGLWFSHWQADVQLLQAHTITLTDGVTSFRIGMFDPYSCNPGPCVNVLTDEGQPFLLVSR